MKRIINHIRIWFLKQQLKALEDNENDHYPMDEETLESEKRRIVEKINKLEKK